MSSGREMILDIFHMEIMYLVILYRSSNEGFMTQLQFFFLENVHADSPMYNYLLLFNECLHSIKHRHNETCNQRIAASKCSYRRILESYRVFIFDDRPRYTRTLLCVRLYVAMRSVCTCILVARSSRTAAARAAELSTFPIGQKSVAGPRDSELEALYETERPASRFANKEQ